MNSVQLLSTWPASMLRTQEKQRGLNMDLYVLAVNRIYGMIIGSMHAVLFVCVQIMLYMKRSYDECLVGIYVCIMLCVIFR